MFYNNSSEVKTFMYNVTNLQHFIYIYIYFHCDNFKET